jgi:hypothetical protein
MRKSKSRLVVLMIITLLWITGPNRVCVAIQKNRSNSSQRKQILAQRISKRTEDFYNAYTREHRVIADRGELEINGHLEDLLMLTDGLSDPQHTKSLLENIMPLASAIERMLLLSDCSSKVVLNWALLHADLDLLAKLYKLQWTDVVITKELLATFGKETNNVLDELLLELPAAQQIASRPERVFTDRLEEFRKVSLSLEVEDVRGRRSQIDKLARMSRTFSPALNRFSLSTSLISKWRLVSSQLEELSRLYSLDSELVVTENAGSPQ